MEGFANKMTCTFISSTYIYFYLQMLVWLVLFLPFSVYFVWNNFLCYANFKAFNYNFRFVTMTQFF